MNIYRSIPVVMVGLWSSVLAAVLTVWKYVVYVSYPIRPLLHLVAFYPLLLVVVLGLWSVVWGYMLEDYDAFHLVWHESWKIGIPNGVLVAFTLGVVTMAVHLADEKAATSSDADKRVAETKRY